MVLEVGVLENLFEEKVVHEVVMKLDRVNQSKKLLPTSQIE